MTDKFSNSLGIPKKFEITDIDSEGNEVANSEVIEYKPSNNNFEKAQRNIEEVTAVGSTAMQELAELAQSSQHPRLYEALTNLLDSIVNANKELIELEKTQLEIDQMKTGKRGPEKIVNNTLFVGSTKDILEQIQKQKENKE